MKKIIFALIFCCATSFLWGQSQNHSGLVFKKLFLDYQTLNGGDFGAFKDYTDGFEVGYFFSLIDQLDIYIPLKVGLGNRTEEEINNRLIGLDVQAQYHLLNNPGIISPYVLAGAGAVYENGDSINFQFPLGIGFDFRIAPNAFFNIQSEFRPSTVENESNFHHGIGFRYVFGKKKEAPEMIDMIVDTDGDGIPDPEDECPNIAGLQAFSGCPDTDGDGIQDRYDACPEYPGLRAFDGCPDADGDGVPDTEDACPNEPGPVDNKGCPVSDRDGDGVPDDEDACPDTPGDLLTNGCPDTDKDGIMDKDDLCPEIPGLFRFNGCPDEDGDGVPDNIDKCPTTAGPVENDGCPIIKKEDTEVLEFAMKAVQFQHGSSNLKSESYAVLNQIRDIMGRYPDYKLEISGHTDNTGGEEFNMELSRERARACYDYLISQGVPRERLHYTGYGETRPIADNNTYTGRSLNRRVEFNLTPGGF